MSDFDDDWAAASGVFPEVFGDTVTYQRGANSVPVTAEVQVNRYEVTDLDGVVTVVTSRDYLVTAADLVLAGAEIVPRAGDRIVETIRGTEQTFEVVPLGQQKEYEQADPAGLSLLIHTKRVA